MFNFNLVNMFTQHNGLETWVYIIPAKYKSKLNWNMSYSSFGGVGPLTPPHSELIWNSESYRESVGLLGWGISPCKAVTYTEEHKHRHISVTRVWLESMTRARAGEDISCFRPGGHCGRHWNMYLSLMYFHFISNCFKGLLRVMSWLTIRMQYIDVRSLITGGWLLLTTQ
jgi:hypothetical protein